MFCSAAEGESRSLELSEFIFSILVITLSNFLSVFMPDSYIYWCAGEKSFVDMTKLRHKAESCSEEAQGPDGGWGWVLVGAMFVSCSLVFGLMRSMGIFFVEFVQYFDESAQAISWISSTGLAAQQFFSESFSVSSNNWS